MKIKEEPFSMQRDELKAALSLVAGKITLIIVEKKFKDEKEGVKMMKDAVEEVFNLVLESK